MTKKKNTSPKWYYNIGFIILTLLVTLVTGYCYKHTYGEIIRNCVMSFLMGIVFLFVYDRSEANDELLFNNSLKRGRNYLLYLIGLISAFALSLLPVTGWPFPLFFTMMALCTGTLPGIIAGSAMLMISVIFSGASYGVFCIYFIAGVISVLIFTDLGHSFHTILPILIQTLFYFFFLAFIILFYLTGPISWESFLIPLFNIFINTILMLIVCRYYNYAFLEKEQNQYLLINDQTFTLLEQCKAKHSEEYYRAIHTSYFTQLIGAALHANPYLCKGGGYYLRLLHFSDDYKKEDLENLMKEHHFPDKLIELIMNCNKRTSDIAVFSSKEEFVVELSSGLIDAIMKDKAKGQGTIGSYDTIVKNILSKYYEMHCLDKLAIDFKEYASLQSILLKEKKYLQMM